MLGRNKVHCESFANDVAPRMKLIFPKAKQQNHFKEPL
jgi:hypothetical protein